MMYQSHNNKPFVPFCETVITRYPSAKALPRHDVMDPKLLHGEIRLTLTAKTPVIVSGGTRIRESGASIALFATDAQGRYRIPGSSLRGLIRQNMQILGLGLVRVGREDEISDQKLANGCFPAQGLPGSYRIPENRDLMDYPHSIMGFVGRKRTESVRGRSKQVSDCYRTRISVGDLRAVGAPKVLHTVLLRQEAPDQSSECFLTRTPDGFRLSGTRQFPPREPAKSQPYGSTQGFRPLDVGTQFSGSIRYRNLHPDELGLLLWCLRLEAGCLQTMGMAKGAGYGQLELQINELLEYDPTELYGSLTGSGIRRGETARRVEELIGAYQAYAAKVTGESLPGMPHIRTFLELRTPKADEPPAAPMPSQKELRKQAKKAAAQASTEDVSSWKAMLSGKFTKN